MMPTISISDATFQKLQALAVPFVDDPESVIATLADRELTRRGVSHPQNSGSREQSHALQLNADRPDDLAHTRVLVANLDGKVIDRPNWLKLMSAIHALAAERLGSFAEVRSRTSANVREGRYEGEGFKYIERAGFSIQAQEANRAWQQTLRLARAIDVPVELRIEWRDKDGAAHPGEMAEISWKPTVS